MDTGPIVAYLNRHDVHHAWAVEQIARLRVPYLTCEAVLAEATYLLQRNGLRSSLVFDLLDLGVLALGFSLEDEQEAVGALMRKYADRPMDLADGCLVRMSELHRDCVVLTLDQNDFSAYRRYRNEVIPAIMPPRPM